MSGPDRRDPARLDRRAMKHGGRRASDAPGVLCPCRVTRRMRLTAGARRYCLACGELVPRIA